ncbi:YbfB/YjiJ family MFS transporter [Brevibacillus sp. SYSU BS000544]|uniref:YbfB/YjiJ family MFS transporter n=1 Tax=Brevibacillus sp. SYSU BS000544 TaxID=3416443 RepID=UPI003CE5B01D
MKSNPILFLLGGMAALIVAMGIGRFAFTPILPLMMDSHLFTAAGAGYLASSNYLGYLVGALGLTVIRPKNRTWLLIGGIIVSVATTWGMGGFQSMEAWLLLRFLSGVASAIVFVVAASIVVEHVSEIQTGVFYGGVGLGILLTGLMVPVLAEEGQWMGAWKGLGLVGLVLGLFSCYALLNRRQTSRNIQQAFHGDSSAPVKRILICLAVAYGLEGLGYIVTGTYLAAYAKESSDIANIATSSWIWVGIAAAPSCVAWSFLATRWGKKWTLSLAMLLQSFGIAIPVIAPSAFALLLGAVLFGATFMGITTITLSFAKDMYPKDSRKIIGLLTTFYGLGQMIGPSVAGLLIAVENSYDTALFGAASIVLLGALVIPLGIGHSDQIKIKLT